MPRRAGAAHELGQLAARERREADAVELGERRDDARAGGHVEPERQRLGREHDLDEALLEELLDDLLGVRQQPGVVHRESAPEQPPVELEEHAAPFVVVGERRQAARVSAASMRSFSSSLVRSIAVHAAALQRLAASPAREDEVDRGEHRAAAQHLDHLEHVVVGRAPRLAESRLLHRVRLRELERAARRVARRVEERMQGVVDGEPHLERDGTLGARHRLDGAAQARHPRGDLADVADRRREPDEPDVARRLDDELLPDGAARVVVDVVDLVEHDVADAVDARGLVVEHVAQDLGGHHDDRRAVVDGVLAGDEPDVVLAETLAEVVELLVAQRFQRRRVDDVGGVGGGPAQRRRRLETAPDDVVGDHGLAAGGRRADQHAARAFELDDRLALEIVERERQRRLVRRDQIRRQCRRLRHSHVVRDESTRSAIRGRAPRHGRRRSAAPSDTSRPHGGCRS